MELGASCPPKTAEEVIILVLRGSCPVSVQPEANENITELCKRVLSAAVAECESAHERGQLRPLGLGGMRVLWWGNGFN